jgi:cardiolipin synthase A/B
MDAFDGTHYRYPWREGNHFELLVDGERFFPDMLQTIRHARQQIMLELYLFESGAVADRFIDAFVAAAERGVRIYLLLDDFGARGLNPSDRLRLSHSGISLTFYNPLSYGRWRRNLFRDHRKLLIVDSHTAYTGGAGITDGFDTRNNPQGWHEVMLKICGPVVQDWQHLFTHTWSAWSGTELHLHSPAAHHCRGSRPGRVTLNSPSRMEIKRSLIKRIRNAEQRIWIATAYFIPSWKIRRQLRRAARNGIDVRLLLPGPHTDHPAVRHAGRRFYSHLLNHGVRIFEYQPRFLHAKMILCDEWLSIGSSNIDRWNLRWNLEANQELLDQQLIAETALLFQRDFGASREIHAESWHYRSWYRRLPEWFWGNVDRWVVKLLRRDGDNED